jgi:hypothetical protein
MGREGHRMDQRSAMSPDRTEDRLNGPKFRCGIEPTVKDERRVFAIARYDVLPHARQPVRSIDAEEIAEGGLTQAVEMFVRTYERRFCIELNASLFANLADRRLDQLLVLINTARRNLRSRFGVVSMVEDEKTVFSFDVNDDPLPQQHRTNRKPLEGGSSAGPVLRNDA